ncbi:hypothetical protein [Halomonas sp. E14]|uniref:hypothetical protein n=1 Tax=Halomonas sp. E14 TaxID=3397245 RepID=UPI00403ECA94
MRGIPRNQLKTRADFMLLQEAALAGELRPYEVADLRRHWQALLDGRVAYEVDRVLAEGEAPDGEEPEYRVMTDEDEASGEAIRTQYRLVETGCSRLVRLGFEVEEVEAALAQLEDK